MLTNWVVAVGVIAPVAVTGFLVLPVPHQHNMLVFLTNIYEYFFVNRQRYFWKGWCNNYGEEETGSEVLGETIADTEDFETIVEPETLRDDE